MLVSNKFEGKKIIKRRGIATEVVIDDIKNGTDLVVDDVANVLRIKNGKSRHMVLSRFAVVGSVKLDMFFVNGGMVIDLKKGMIIADLGDNKFAKVTKKGVEHITSVSDKKTIEGVNWVTYDGLFNTAKVLIGHKYRLGTEKEKDMYIHNLAYNLLIDEGSSSVSEWGLTIKFVNFYTDLGLGKFDFSIGNYKQIVEKPKKRSYKSKEEKEVDIDDSIIDTLVGRLDISEE